MTFNQQLKAITQNPTERTKALAKVAQQHYNAINSDKWHRAMIGVVI